MLHALEATSIVLSWVFGYPIYSIPNEFFPCVLGHKIIPDLVSDISGSCRMFAEAIMLTTRLISRDVGLVVSSSY